MRSINWWKKLINWRAKKVAKNNVLDQILGIAFDISKITNVIPNAEQVYHITKDVAENSSNAIVINGMKDKIRKMIIEIGERIYKNNIRVEDRNIKAEVDCIKELMKVRPK